MSTDSAGTGNSGREYVVVARFPSSVIFPDGHNFRIESPRPDQPPVEFIFTTRYSDRGFGAVRVPGVIEVEARGSFPTIEDAINRFANRADRMLSVLSVISNAWIGFVEVEFAYDNSPGEGEHEYLQVYVSEEPVEVLPNRGVPLADAMKVLAAIADSGRRERRFLLVASQYAAALGHWKRGHEMLALNHLFMGMEGLKPLALEHHLKETGLSRTQLAQRWGHSDSNGCESCDKRHERDLLEAETRRRILFQGDAKCHRIARDARVAFVHGIASRPSEAAQVVVKTARYLRTAFLLLSGVEPSTQSRLLAHPYADPIGPLHTVKHLRAQLHGRRPLAASGEPHPRREWRAGTITQVFRDEQGYGLDFREDGLGPWRVGDSVQVKSESLKIIEAWKLPETQY